MLKHHMILMTTFSSKLLCHRIIREGVGKLPWTKCVTLNRYKYKLTLNCSIHEYFRWCNVKGIAILIAHN